jgi:hypothetical protein
VFVQINGEVWDPATDYRNPDYGFTAGHCGRGYVCVNYGAVPLFFDGIGVQLVLYSGYGYEGNVCGVLGNFNGNAAGDLVTKDGTDVSGAANPGKEVGDSWIVKDGEQPDQS